MTIQQNQGILSVPASSYNWLRNNLAFVLLLLALILFISKSLYNIPIGVMAILGLIRTIKFGRQVFKDSVTRIYILLFLCLWLPLLLSLPDAANKSHSAQTVFPYLRFLFMGIYILSERNNIIILPKIRAGTFIIASFWAVDGCIQYLAGANLAGFPYESGHITGMFYPRNTIAHILAALSPLYFESVRRYSKRHKWLWLLILPLIAVILLSGRRAAWIMLVISVAGYFYYLFKLAVIGKTTKNNLLYIVSAGLLTVMLVILGNKPLQDRIITTAGLFSLDYETTDIATARRLPIWETAVTVFQDNWISGVGPRGFRHVYQQYSTEDNFWHETSMTHPHQLLLEVLAETGLIGLAGLIIFIWVFCKSFLFHPQTIVLFPWIISILIIMFPFSSNLAFYSSYWSSVIWWFLVLSCLTLQGCENHRVKF